jgi:hypothetical protein
MGTGAAVTSGLLKPVAIVAGVIGVGAVVTTLAVVGNPLKDRREEAWVSPPQKPRPVKIEIKPPATPPAGGAPDQPQHTVTRLKTARHRPEPRRQRQARPSTTEAPAAAEPADPATDRPGGGTTASSEMPLGPPPKPLPPPPPVDTTLGDEQVLLERARTALRSGEARRAQSLIADHRRRYPEGKLTEERDALAIRILVRLGQRAAAKREAHAFRQRYPRSMLLPVVEQALRAPARR